MARLPTTVHRRTATLLILVLALSVLMPYVSLAAEADAELPPCCRGNGEHKCAMRMAMALARRAQQQGDACQSIACRCPMQKGLTPAGRLAIYPAPSSAIGADWVSYAAIQRQAELSRLVSRARSHQKRGPPFPALIG
jgi:acetyl esterase/lipase